MKVPAVRWHYIVVKPIERAPPNTLKQCSMISYISLHLNANCISATASALAVGEETCLRNRREKC